MSNLWNYLEGKMNSIREDFNQKVDVVVNNVNANGAKTTIVFGNNDVKKDFQILPEFIDMTLTRIHFKEGSVIIKKGMVTKFFSAVEKVLSADPNVVEVLKQNLGEEYTKENEILFKVTEIPDNYNFVVDRKLEFHIGEAGTIDNKNIIKLKMSPERASNAEQMQSTFDKELEDAANKQV